MAAPKPWPLSGSLARLDVDALLSSGSVEGPYRRARPALSWWARLIQVLRSWQIKRMKP